MNCWRGICKYKTDNSNLCMLDVEKGNKPKKCDIEKKGQCWHECRHGNVPCKQCWWYYGCIET